MTNPQLAPQRIQDPNHFTLNGSNHKVKFSMAGPDGQAHFRFQDSHQVMNFVGDQITIESTVLGQLATVTILDTEGVGHTTFTLIIPAVDVSRGPQTVATLGITTMHRTSPSAVARGQLRSYHLTEMRGSAKHRELPD